MQPFRKSPQHNTSTSTAINYSTLLEDEEYAKPLFAGLREIASIQEKVFLLQDKVEHPTLYLTQADVEAGKTLFRNMHETLGRSRQEIIDIIIEEKLAEIHNEMIEFKSVYESQKVKYKEIEKKLIEYGYVPPARYIAPPVLTDIPTIAANSSFNTNNLASANLPVISPSPIPVHSPENQVVQDIIAPFIATPELFRKLSKQSRVGAEHVKAVMRDCDDDIDETYGNEPARDIQMTLAGPIRADRHIPPPLSESPVCLREFRFPTTPTQSYSNLDQINTEPSVYTSNSNNLISRKESNSIIPSDVITEEEYNSLASYIVSNVTLLELNTALTRLREFTRCADSGQNLQLNEQLLANEVGNTKWSQIRLALLKLKLM
ncbi:hypothetical protein LOD99_7768 [Oopsacas minuta]|uniref:Spindle and kinetochore-associated protein 3 n=1 Tax=Oopsacas minuta TaxID=111878 RepID=A0AAV7JP07_9METZ|nr:hypothetical protein LOD99_7768 [Oopsacas minuta]